MSYNVGAAGRLWQLTDSLAGCPSRKSYPACNSLHFR